MCLKYWDGKLTLVGRVWVINKVLLGVFVLAKTTETNGHGYPNQLRCNPGLQSLFSEMPMLEPISLWLEAVLPK